MKKLATRLVCLMLVLSLLPLLFGCTLVLDIDSLFPTKPEDPGSDEPISGSLDISGGTPTEWGVGGYVINSSLEDNVVKTVSSVAEGNAWIDAAIMSHIHSITIDFSSVYGYSPTETGLEIELSNHVTIEKRYYDAKPKVVEFVISYEDDAATFFVTPTKKNDHETVISGNLFARLASIPEDERRSEDFDDFAINSVVDTLDVHNSEELWWALSRGFRPTFPLENSKAENFYLEAKRILRHIVTDSMTDYEKLISIYEYLVSAVEYDYDSFYSVDTSWHGKNACYYLEGVFESGRAVCDGKSKALVLFASIEGIECVRDFGKSLDSDMSHAWNYVKLDGLWYLVDTTEGDTCMDGDVAEFLGDSAELISYDSFLKPLDYYESEYMYSAVCADISGLSYSLDRSAEHYEAGFFDGTGYDFVINRSGELSAICGLAFEALDGSVFSLTLKYEHFLGIQQAMSQIMIGKNYEHAIFVLDEAEGEYLIIFNPRPAPTE